MTAKGRHDSVNAIATASRWAEALPDLVLAAERVAATVAQGLHGRRRAGPGGGFWQYRRYQAGDPVRSIDWRRSARSEHVHVREQEWEAAQTLWLWVDSGVAMDWRADETLPRKGDRARLLALALAAVALRAGERVAVAGSGQPPVSGPGRLAAVAEALLAATVPLNAREVAPHGEVVLIGDFLAPAAGTATLVQDLAARAVRGHLVQVLDPAEVTLPWNGRVRFLDMEGQGELVVRRVEAVRETYHERLEQHRIALREAARAAGFDLTQHQTDQPPEGVLLAVAETLRVSGGGA